MSESPFIHRAVRRSLRRPSPAFVQAGHSLIEMVVVLSLLGVCLASGVVLLGHGLSAVEARGAAQTWQAAAAWAQIGAVRQGVTSDLAFESGRVEVSAEAATSSGDLGTSAPDVDVVANVVRWQQGDGVVVRFLSGTAYPNSAGSLYFKAAGGDYRVIVRLESGLTVRERVEAAP